MADDHLADDCMPWAVVAEAVDACMSRTPIASSNTAPCRTPLTIDVTAQPTLLVKAAGSATKRSRQPRLQNATS
jgi:hypothetical protein